MTGPIGLLIDEKLTVPGAQTAQDEEENDDEGIKGNFKKLRTVKRISRLVETMRTGHDQLLIDANKSLICRLPAEGYGTMEFDMDDARRGALVKAAEVAMTEHLATRV